MKRFLSAVATALLLAAGPASADIIFTLSGALDDGGTVSGSFTTDDAVLSLLDYDITTSGSNGFTYNTTTAPQNLSSLPFILVVETADLSHILEVTFAGGLTATGANVLVGAFDSFEQIPGGTHRQITQGSAAVSTTPVPEPSTIALLGIAVLGIAAFVRRKRR
jgi:hypothetical protein